MIAFGCATTNDQEFKAHAAPAIERVAEPDSLIMRRHGCDSIHDPYNEMLVEAGAREDLEALALLHQDVSIEDEHFVLKVRGLLAASPEIAVIGVAGARDVPGLQWWEGECHGRLTSPRIVPGGSTTLYSSGAHEVDSVDGMLLVLSAWAVRELRFDRDLAGSLDGYDMDICLQARARGGRVVVGELSISHHAPNDFLDRRRWVDAAVAIQRKWGADLVPRRI